MKVGCASLEHGAKYCGEVKVTRLLRLSHANPLAGSRCLLRRSLPHRCGLLLLRRALLGWRTWVLRLWSRLLRCTLRLNLRLSRSLILLRRRLLPLRLLSLLRLEGGLLLATGRGGLLRYTLRTKRPHWLNPLVPVITPATDLVDTIGAFRPDLKSVWPGSHSTIT